MPTILATDVNGGTLSQLRKLQVSATGKLRVLDAVYPESWRKVTLIVARD